MNELKCLICGSTNLLSDGFTKDKRQRYRCKDCGKYGTEPRKVNTTNSEIKTPKAKKIIIKKLPTTDSKSPKIKCPSCFSTSYTSDGLSKGTQFYRCKSCGKRFSEKTTCLSLDTIAKIKKLSNLGQSNAQIAKELAVSKDSVRKYREGVSTQSNNKFKPIAQELINQILEMTKQNIHVTQIANKLNVSRDTVRRYAKTLLDLPVCPHCQSTDIRKRGVDEYGKQKYSCNTCLRKFTNNTGVRLQKSKINKPKNEIPCPVCGSLDLYKNGKDARGNQQYRCKSCNKCFIYGGGYTKIQYTPEQIEEMRECRRNGMLMKDLAAKFSIGERSLRKYVSDIIVAKPVPKKKTSSIKSDKPIVKAKKTTVVKKIIPKTIKPVESPKREIQEKPKNMVSKIEESKETEVIEIKDANKTLDKETVYKNTVMQDDEFYRELEREQKKLEIQAKREEYQRNMLLKKQKEEHLAELTKIYTAKLKSEFSIPENFLMGFDVMREQYISNEIDKNTVDNHFNSLLSEAIKILEQKEQEKFLADEQAKPQHIIDDVLNGMSEQKAADKYKVSLEEVQHIVYPEYQKEHINEEQKHTIIKYGIMMKVPVEYMAEYVHCSENMCKIILEKYKNVSFNISDETKQKIMKTR